MIETQSLFPNCQSLLIECKCLCVLLLHLVEACKVMQAVRHIGMLWTQVLLTKGQGAPMQWQGLLVVSQFAQECCQPGEGVCNFRMLRTQCLFPDPQRALI